MKVLVRKLSQVNIIACTSLKRLNGCQNGSASLEITIGTTIKDILQSLEAAPGEVGLVILNGEKVGSEALVKDGDKIELYPVFGGG